MTKWSILATVFALSTIFGVVLDLAFVDERVVDLWSYRNQLFPMDRGGLISGIAGISTLVLYAICIYLFYRRSNSAPAMFFALLVVVVVGTLYFGPSVSTIWSEALGVLAISSGAYMSGVLIHERSQAKSQ